MALEPAGSYIYSGELEYPKGIRVFVDGEDISQYVFGKASVDATLTMHQWNEIDLSVYCRTPGRHVLSVTSESPGRVESRVEVR